jgi:nitroreductase
MWTDVFDAVRTVLAVRRYTSAPVPADVIERIVEAGRLAGSSINLQPWHFIVVADRAVLTQIGGVIRSGRYVSDAAFAIVVVVEKGSAFAVSDASRAIQNMILVAWSDGVGSNWVGFGPMPKVTALLGVPKTHEGLAVVPFGYPTLKLGRGRKRRKSLSQVASRERFGTPFAK